MNYDFVLSTESPYITIDHNTAGVGGLVSGSNVLFERGTLSHGRYGTIGADFLFDGDGDFRFTISNDCPRGIKIPFSMKISDSMGNEWTESFMLSIEP